MRDKIKIVINFIYLNTKKMKRKDLDKLVLIIILKK